MKKNLMIISIQCFIAISLLGFLEAASDCYSAIGLPLPKAAKDAINAVKEIDFANSYSFSSSKSPANRWRQRIISKIQIYRNDKLLDTGYLTYPVLAESVYPSKGKTFHDNPSYTWQSIIFNENLVVLRYTPGSPPALSLEKESYHDFHVEEKKAEYSRVLDDKEFFREIENNRTFVVSFSYQVNGLTFKLIFPAEYINFLPEKGLHQVAAGPIVFGLNYPILNLNDVTIANIALPSTAKPEVRYMILSGSSIDANNFYAGQKIFENYSYEILKK